MRQVELRDAGSRLPELCREVARTGEDVVILQAGQPLARISSLAAIPAAPPELDDWADVREWEAFHPHEINDEIPARPTSAWQNLDCDRG